MSDAAKPALRTGPRPSGALRCPYCHEDVPPEASDWVACRACAARHHGECWGEGGACAACGDEQALVQERGRAAPARQRSLVARVLVGGLLLLLGAGLAATSEPGPPAPRVVEQREDAPPGPSYPDAPGFSEDYVVRLRSLERSLENAPDSPSLLRAHARAMLHVGQLEEALADYERVVEVHPEDARGYLGRGLVWALLGEPSLSRAALEEAHARAQDQHVQAWTELVRGLPWAAPEREVRPRSLALVLRALEAERRGELEEAERLYQAAWREGDVDTLQHAWALERLRGLRRVRLFDQAPTPR